ncbi:MAG: outer membrane protein/peptidoglycan-associated protein [Acidobacteria bacterium]|nr:outer membrane protein/peptidoglycan-associated protein [Acidobacteriota bacterium]
MRKLLLLLAVSLAFAPATLAQNYSDWEFYVGYAHERANNGADRLDITGRRILPNGSTAAVDFRSERRVPHNGVVGEVVANLNEHVGIVANFAATFADTTLVDNISGKSFNAKLQRYTFLMGPRFNWRNSTPLIPFAHALFGAAHYRAKFPDKDISCTNKEETAFAMGFGAGLDIKAGKHFDVRAGEVDYIPVFFSHKREDNLRFSAGVKIK